MLLNKNQNEDFFKYESCPICKSKNIKIKYPLISSVNDPDVKFDMFYCNTCKLHFIGQKVTNEYLSNFYNCNINDNSVYSEDNLKQLNFYYLKLKKYIEKFIDKGKILDIGCSGGYFLDIMNGWERYGCEICENDAIIAKEKYGNNIFIGSFDDYNNKDILFDVITLQDCLDHTINPYDVIAKCYNLLKQDGLLVIKVHNIDCLFAKCYGKNFYAIIPPAHLFYFNKKSMNNLLKMKGFKILGYKYIPHILKISTVFLRFAKGNKNSIFYKLYLALQDSFIGNIGIFKNLHDIFTVFAKKI